MSCINKADKGYKALVNVYGDALTEAFVRSFPKNKSGEDVEFYIPTKVEVQDWLRYEKANKFESIMEAFAINPYMSEDGIISVTKGVLYRKAKKVYVLNGNINNLGIYGKNPEAAQILNLNMRIMNSLASRYPDVFTIEPSRSQENTYRVLITPRVKPEETVVDNESDLANSMRVYAQTVEANRGLKPKMFIAGNYTWALNKNNLYNLMDKLTGFTFLKNVDLETGSVVPETVSVSMPVSEEKVDKMFRQIMGMIKHEHMADLLAVQGIDTRDIYEQLRDAKTEADLNKINETLLKALC
jgi:hypothetical protein